MDDVELRAALGQRIAEEVDAQFSQYRGAVSARTLCPFHGDGSRP